ncbi:MAG: PIN domain-containing protein [Capsulimonas sp.]|uniref:type II toxin-antitoxin system VapC family toxin n=1 Tax=Capsulimonas sp. TaxID=2494211 RepID=UPI003265A7A0
MRYLLDTNILLRQFDPASSSRMLTLEALKKLHREGAELCVLPQNIIEFWGVATRPQSVNGLGLTVEQAEAERLRIESLFRLIPDPKGIYERWASLVNTHQVLGKNVHDTRIVAAMLEAGITHMLTFNDTHFRRFEPEIIVVNPDQI